ncbi:MAG: hypothetical protein ACYCVZ_05170 [Streptosporangiaceae bacterium]
MVGRVEFLFPLQKHGAAMFFVCRWPSLRARLFHVEVQQAAGNVGGRPRKDAEKPVADLPQVSERDRESREREATVRRDIRHSVDSPESTEPDRVTGLSGKSYPARRPTVVAARNDREAQRQCRYGTAPTRQLST